MKKQVDKSSYSKGYVSQHRWMSYYNQIQSIESLKPKSVLEIGSATFVTANYFKSIHSGVDYKIVDIDPELNPDYLGSITAIPVQNDTFDVVCAFQVLEHIPYGEIDFALQELHRVSKRFVVISLPHHGSHVRFEFKIPFFNLFRFAYKFPSSAVHKFDGEHYWEIGKRDYKLKNVINKLESNNKFKILANHIPYDTQYHRFFILEKKFL